VSHLRVSRLVQVAFVRIGARVRRIG